MKEPIVLWHRAGLGDHIIAAGLVNWLAQIHQTVHLIVAKPFNWHSVKWLFDSLPQVQPHLFDNPSDQQIKEFAQSIDAPLLTSMFDYPLQRQIPAWQGCYEEYGLDYRTRYQLWPNVKPGPRSQELFSLLVRDNRPYRVVHASASERPWFDIELAPGGPNLDTVYVNSYVSNNIFDWHDLLINAKEVHVIDSSVLHLAASLCHQLQGKVIFHHIKDHGYFPNPWEQLLKYHPQWQIEDYPFKQWRK